jgi:hypothetical protein
MVQETAFVPMSGSISSSARTIMLAVWLARIAANEALGRVRGWGRAVSIDEYAGHEDGAGRPIETITLR